MYELPSHGNITRVVLDESAIDGQGKPLLIYGDESEKKVRVSKEAQTILKDAAA